MFGIRFSHLSQNISLLIRSQTIQRWQVARPRRTGFESCNSRCLPISKRERGQEIVLKRRDSYHTVNGEQVRRKPHFETVRFKIIENPNTALLSMKGDLEEMMLA